MLYHISSQHCSQYKSLLVDRHCQGNDETKVNKGEQWEHLVRIMIMMMIMIVVMIAMIIRKMAKAKKMRTRIGRFRY